jgi:hypothetical protein
MAARTRLLVLLAIVLLATACAETGEPAGSPSPGDVPEVLRFDAPLLGGGALHGPDLAGKDVAFWFWAPW